MRVGASVTRSSTVVHLSDLATGLVIAGEDCTDEDISILESVQRPHLRSDCPPPEWIADGTRRRCCPWVGCRHHLGLNVTATGGLQFPAGLDVPPWELEWCCSLDVAELGGLTLDECGELFGVSRERVRQLEVKPIRRLKPQLALVGLIAAEVREALAEIDDARASLQSIDTFAPSPASRRASVVECAEVEATEDEPRRTGRPRSKPAATSRRGRPPQARKRSTPPAGWSPRTHTTDIAPRKARREAPMKDDVRQEAPATPAATEHPVSMPSETSMLSRQLDRLEELEALIPQLEDERNTLLELAAAHPTMQRFIAAAAGNPPSVTVEWGDGTSSAPTAAATPKSCAPLPPLSDFAASLARMIRDAEGPMSVGRIIKASGKSKTMVYAALKTLRTAGLVESAGERGLWGWVP